MCNTFSGWSAPFVLQVACKQCTSADDLILCQVTQTVLRSGFTMYKFVPRVKMYYGWVEVSSTIPDLFGFAVSGRCSVFNRCQRHACYMSFFVQQVQFEFGRCDMQLLYCLAPKLRDYCTAGSIAFSFLVVM